MNNRMLTKSALFSAVAFSAAFGAQSAAAAIIDEWEYEAHSTFSDFTETAGNGQVTGSDSSDELGGHTKLSWGDSDDTSSLSVKPAVVENPPPLETNGGTIEGSTITHNNQAIPASSAMLDAFKLQTRLDLTATTANGDAVSQQVGPITFDSFFFETYNENSVDGCVEGSQSACDDIFVLANTPLGGEPSNGDGYGVSQSFTVDDYRYTVFLEIDELGELTDAQCAAANADAGCIGFLTQEGQENSFNSSFSIEAAQVPEPGSLALLGLGLVGFGYARRRRNDS